MEVTTCPIPLYPPAALLVIPAGMAESDPWGVGWEARSCKIGFWESHLGLFPAEGGRGSSRVVPLSKLLQSIVGSQNEWAGRDL